MLLSGFSFKERPPFTELKMPHSNWRNVLSHSRRFVSAGAGPRILWPKSFQFRDEHFFKA
jgi:hypothetical protein